MKYVTALIYKRVIIAGRPVISRGWVNCLALLFALFFASTVLADKVPYDPASTPQDGLGATKISNLVFTDPEVSAEVSNFYYDFLHEIRDESLITEIKQLPDGLSELPRQVFVDGDFIRAEYERLGKTVPNKLDRRIKKLRSKFADVAAKAFESLFPAGTFDLIARPRSLIEFLPNTFVFTQLKSGRLNWHFDNELHVRLVKTVDRAREGIPTQLGTAFPNDLDAVEELLASTKEREFYDFSLLDDYRTVSGQHDFSAFTAKDYADEFATEPTFHAGPPKPPEHLAHIKRYGLVLSNPFNRNTFEYRRLMIVRLSYLVQGGEEALKVANRLLKFDHPEFQILDSLAMANELTHIEKDFQTLDETTQNRIKKRYGTDISPTEHLRSTVIPRVTGLRPC